VALLVPGVLLAGCSKKPPLAEVTGTVKMAGKPLGNVKVTFHPDPDKGTKGPASIGKTDASGQFTLKCEDGRSGALVGYHRAILTDLDVYGDKFVGRAAYRKADERGVPVEVPKKPRFSERFSSLERTPFKPEVKEGMSPVELEIKR